MELPYAKTGVATVVSGSLLFAGYWVATETRKEVPGRVVLVAGSTQYFELAASLRPALEKNGVKLEIVRKIETKIDAKQKASPTFETLHALVDPDGSVNAAFVKGGLFGSLKGSLSTEKAQLRRKELSELKSVGRVMLEPIWVFTRSEDAHLKSLHDLMNKRILTGSRESGSRRVAHQLLKANGIDKANAERIEQELKADASQLINREADAAILILPADNDVIRDLLKVKGIRLMNFENADAYVNRFPALTKVRIPAGAVDFANSFPPEDTTLLATEVALVVRPTLDHALVLTAHVCRHHQPQVRI